MDTREFKLIDLIEQNYLLPSVLERLGVNYEQNLNKTLLEIAEEYFLDANQLTKSVNAILFGKAAEFNLEHFPLPVLVAYLKSTHHDYAKWKLPVLNRHIEMLEGYSDLKREFSKFKCDLSKHIILEEKVIFPFIEDLNQLSYEFDPYQLEVILKANDTELLFAGHGEDDDDMHEIRFITKNYRFKKSDSLGFKIIMTELKNLEKDLKIHAQIEELILFKKARDLENSLKLKLKQTIKSN